MEKIEVCRDWWALAKISVFCWESLKKENGDVSPKKEWK
ncbi:hypothetical protein MIDIC_160002 [Alphaproteobacteria bacterium]